MTTILVPLDMSPATAAALPVADRLAKELRADVVLLAVSELAETSEQAAEVDAQQKDIFAQAAPFFAGVHVRRRAETARSPAAAILHAIQEERAGHVVLATHGPTGQTQVAQDGVADEVVAAGLAQVTLVPCEMPPSLVT